MATKKRTCTECGALVAPQGQQLHSNWHRAGGAAERAQAAAARAGVVAPPFGRPEPTFDPRLLDRNIR